jgi:glycosyltransferase involved in cell wall biosynthesis
MRSPRRVLLLSYWLEPGGTERQLTAVATRMDRSRFEPRAGCILARGSCLGELRDAGVPVAEFPMRGLLRPSYWRAVSRLRKYIREERIDIVHSFDVPATLFAVPVARAAGAPAVLSSQRAYRDLTPGKRPFLRLTDHMVDGIVVNSSAVRDDLIRRDRVPSTLIHYCPNGVDLDVFSPPGERRKGPVRIGIVSWLRPEKSIETLIDAFAKLRETGVEATLTVVGGGQMSEALQRRAVEKNLVADCHFEPLTRSVAEWLRSFDIFVLPSRSEALSNALMEAMACGCCSIASRTGGNPELIEHGVSGLLFSPGAVEDLTEKLRLAASDPVLRVELASAGARRIREGYSLAASVRRLEEIYDALPAARSGAYN